MELQYLNYYPFKILENKQYPNMDNNGQFRIILSELNLNVTIVEQWATGNLYIILPDVYPYPYPLRYNTNLLDPINSINYVFEYDYNRQGFLLYKKI